MTAQSPLPVGETVTLKVIVRVFGEGHPHQIFGTIISGAEHLDLPQGDTVMVVGKFLIEGGIKAVDTEKWASAMSFSSLMHSI